MIENITAAIDPKQMPEIEEFYVYKAIEEINKAIETYVKMNLIHGCMQRTSNSFNWLANADDGSCTGSVSHVQFGGFIRTCSISWSTGESFSPRDDLCSGIRRSNFHTTTESCPLGFTRQLLHTSQRSQRYERTRSWSCGFLWLSTCYETIWIGTAYSTASLYICTKNSSGLTQHTFGGSFTSNKINLITNDKTCPARYRAVHIVNDIYTCYTEQIFDSHVIPKFGGMFSCQTRDSLNSESGACPVGFSAYVMGVIENDCIVHVCLQLKTQDIRNLPSISLPPYFNLFEQINITAPINISVTIINDSNLTGEYDPSVRTLRMNARIIYQDSNLASKTYISWSFTILVALSWYLISSVY